MAWARARVRQGWASPTLRLVGVLLVVSAALVETAPLRALEPWQIPPAATVWITLEQISRPKRLVEGERAEAIGRLPLAPGPKATQIFHLMPGPPPDMKQMALLAPALSADEVLVLLNGTRLEAPVMISDRPAGAPSTQAMLWDAPDDYRRPGLNRIDILLTGRVGRTMSAPLYLGPRAVLRQAADRSAIWGGAWRRWLIPVGLAVALLAVMAAALGQRRRMALLAAGALTAALAARATLGETSVVSELGQYWGAVDRLTVSLGLLSLAQVLVGRRGLRARPAVGAGLTAVMAGAWVLDLLAPRLAPGLASPAAWTVILLSMTMVVSAALCSGSLDWRGSALRRAEAAATFAVLSLVLAITTWTGLARFVGLSGLAMDVAYVVAALATMAATAMAAGWIGVGGAVRLARARLDQGPIIRRQQAQIEAAASALEQEMRRAAILDERQRLARDMHDGVGGQLVSLIARLRSQRISIDQVEGELMKGLSELRMVVDSLDATGQSLADAMLAFRLRAQTQVEGAGMTLEWTQPVLDKIETDDPRWVLTLYRFMQEAVTNAVRHSGGQRVRARVDWREDRRLTVEISDDGGGFDVAAPRTGKGLRNLEFRAGQLGGTLQIEARPQGTRVRLETPLPEA